MLGSPPKVAIVEIASFVAVAIVVPTLSVALYKKGLSNALEEAKYYH